MKNDNDNDRIENSILKIWERSNRRPSEKAFFDCLLQDPAFWELPRWKERIEEWKTGGERNKLKKAGEYLKRAKNRKPPQKSKESREGLEILLLWIQLKRFLEECNALEEAGIESRLILKFIDEKFIPFYNPIFPPNFPKGKEEAKKEAENSAVELLKNIASVTNKIDTSKYRNYSRLTDGIIGRIFGRTESYIKQLRKARLCAQGYKENEDQVQDDTPFSPAQDKILLKDVLVSKHRKRYD